MTHSFIKTFEHGVHFICIGIGATRMSELFQFFNENTPRSIRYLQNPSEEIVQGKNIPILVMKISLVPSFQAIPDSQITWSVPDTVVGMSPCT